MNIQVKLDNFNIRQMQAYAAICLWRFCSCLSLRHGAIDELFLHLITILTANNLPEWEQKGAQIAITGRGDPLPRDVQETISQEYLKEFNSLVESCVEVGIVDMYGESTEQPKIYLHRCLKILSDANIDLPSEEVLAKYGDATDQWGKAISKSELAEILDAYAINYS